MAKRSPIWTSFPFFGLRALLGTFGANLAALVSEQAFDDLDAPVQRVAGADVPMPYSKPLEDIAYPPAPQIVHAALACLNREPAAPATQTEGAAR